MNKSFLNNHSVRGLRNNNVGNLVKTAIEWQGKIKHSQNTDARFEQFTHLKFGIRAMLRDLVNDISKGKNTVSKLISEYAPSFENNTTAYVDSVCKTLGIKADTKITKVNNDFLLVLARAIMKVELGASHKDVTDSDIKEAISILGTFNLPNLTVDSKAPFLNTLKTYVTPILISVGIFFYTCVTLTL